MKKLEKYAGQGSKHFNPKAKYHRTPIIGEFYLAEDVDKVIASLQRKIVKLEK